MTRSQLFLLILILVGIAVFNSNNPSAKSSAQIDFEKWTNTLEADLRKDKSELPKMSLSLSSKEISADMVLNNDNRDKLLRLLQLLREANLFSLDVPNSRSDNIKLRISGPSRNFQIDFNKEQISNNMPARNFLKLYQLYSPPPLISNNTKDKDSYGS